MLERPALGIDPRKRRQQRRVDIENRLRERIEQRRTDQSHEPRETDEAHITLRELPGQRAIVVLARAPATMVDAQRFESGLSRALQSCGIFTVGNHDNN